MVSGIHTFLLIYIRQEAGGKKQTAGVELVVVLVFGIKAADMYVSQGMDEAFVAQIDADMRMPSLRSAVALRPKKTRSPRCTLEKSGAISMRSPT